MKLRKQTQLKRLSNERKKEFEMQIEKNGQMINQLHEENKSLQERMQDGGGGDSAGMREKYKELVAQLQKRSSEMSQLKMVNERISKENEMWSKKIDKAEESNS